MAGTSSNIPTEIRSDEGIASTEAGLASAASSPVISAAITTTQAPTLASQSQGNAICVQSDSAQTKRSLFSRSRRGLSVTDVSETKWCDMQTEVSLLFREFNDNETKPGEKGCSQKQIDLDPSFRRRRRNIEAIRVGMGRHVQLEREVLSPMKVKVKLLEDYMAVKLVNFINGLN